MKNLMIHGVYDSKTLMTLKDLGIKEFSFDLRGRSLNLVSFRDLQNILKSLVTEKVFVTFQDDKKETVLSAINLLSSQNSKFTLVFRDTQNSDFYESLNTPFLWMFNPEGDWKGILNLPNCKGVLLPLKYQKDYQINPELWKVIEEKDLKVYLHADSFEEALLITHPQDVNLCIDLTSEVESSYRMVDQEKLKNVKIWRR